METQLVTLTDADIKNLTQEYLEQLNGTIRITTSVLLENETTKVNLFKILSNLSRVTVFFGENEASDLQRVENKIRYLEVMFESYPEYVIVHHYVATRKEQLQSKCEELEMQLNEAKTFVEVPGDGNCFFYAFLVALLGKMPEGKLNFCNLQPLIRELRWVIIQCLYCIIVSTTDPVSKRELQKDYANTNPNQAYPPQEEDSYVAMGSWAATMDIDIVSFFFQQKITIIERAENNQCSIKNFPSSEHSPNWKKCIEDLRNGYADKTFVKSLVNSKKPEMIYLKLSYVPSRSFEVSGLGHYGAWVG